MFIALYPCSKLDILFSNLKIKFWEKAVISLQVFNFTMLRYVKIEVLGWILALAFLLFNLF